MIDLPTETLQLVFIDTLFLCVCGALCLWLRNWIKFQQREIENRLSILERHHDMIAELGKRLQSTTYAIEKMNVSLSKQSNESVNRLKTPSRDTSTALPTTFNSSTSRTGGAQKHSEIWDSSSANHSIGRSSPTEQNVTSDHKPDGSEDYAMARELLEKGMSHAEIARRSGLGLAEVEMLQRMRDFSR